MDEYTGEMEDDFSVQVCKRWEAAFNSITLPHTRKIILRIAITLGAQGGVMEPYLNHRPVPYDQIAHPHHAGRLHFQISFFATCL